MTGKVIQIYVATKDQEYLVAFENLVNQHNSDERRKRANTSKALVALMKKAVDESGALKGDSKQAAAKPEDSKVGA